MSSPQKLTKGQPRQAFAKKHKYDGYVARSRTIGISIGSIAAALAGCFSVYYVFVDDAPRFGGALLLPVATWCAVTAASIGIALLFAPNDYYETGQGKEYLEKIGVTSPLGARVAIATGLLIGFSIVAFPTYLIIRIAVQG